MDLDILVRLEEKIDQLLQLKQRLEQDCAHLREERDTLVQEREFVTQELDRILARLDVLD